MVVVPGTDGDFGVLAGHAPFMSTIRPGAISIYRSEGATPERIFIDGGFAEVNEKGLTILAEGATPVTEVDPSKVERDLSDAREDIKLAKSPREANVAERQIERLAALKAALAACSIRSGGPGWNWIFSGSQGFSAEPTDHPWYGI